MILQWLAFWSTLCRLTPYIGQLKLHNTTYSIISKNEKVSDILVQLFILCVFYVHFFIPLHFWILFLFRWRGTLCAVV